MNIPYISEGMNRLNCSIDSLLFGTVKTNTEYKKVEAWLEKCFMACWSHGGL